MSASVTGGLSPFRQVLDNGVAVVVQETAFSPAVTISLGFRAGSLYEPDNLPGLASFVGRVIDRGTTSRSADDIADAFDDRGVAVRVATNRHVTTLSCTCLSEDFADVLAVLSDIPRHPTFPDDQIERRRVETVTAIRQDQDSTGIRASEMLQALLYPDGHPYGRPAKGTIDSIERVSRGDLVAHHAARFAPSTLTAVVVGDVNARFAVERIAAAFEGWTTRPSGERGIPAVIPGLGSRVTIEMAEKSQSDIAYGFVSISRLDPSYCAHWMMNMILGQFGLGGRLAENIRERQGMAYYAFSSFDPGLGPGPLVIRAGVDPVNVARTLDAIDAEVGSLGRDGVTEREFLETRQFLIGSIPRMLENNASIAVFLQTSEFFGLGLDYDRRLPALLQAVTREQVNAAAAAVLEPSRACAAVAGPLAAPDAD